MFSTSYPKINFGTSFHTEANYINNRSIIPKVILCVLLPDRKTGIEALCFRVPVTQQKFEPLLNIFKRKKNTIQTIEGGKETRRVVKF